MKLFAKCSASVSLSDQVHGKVCNPIPLILKHRVTLVICCKFSPIVIMIF